MLTLPITYVYVEEIAIHVGGSKGKGVARQPLSSNHCKGPPMRAQAGEQLHTISTTLRVVNPSQRNAVREGIEPQEPVEQLCGSYQ